MTKISLTVVLQFWEGKIKFSIPKLPLPSSLYISQVPIPNSQILTARLPPSSHGRLCNRAPPPIPTTLQPQTGEYTKERLLELQKNARSLASSPPKPPHKSEPVILLRGLIKPDPIAAKSEEEEAETAEAEKKGESGIPDQDTINAIRAKRELLRQSQGPAPDYISLDGGGALATRPGGESSDEEDRDFRGRIVLSTVELASRGVFEPEDERDESDDEEERRWEEEQFRKGLGKRFEAAEEVSRVRSGSSSVVQPPVGPQHSVYLGILPQHPVALRGLSLSEPSMTITEKAEVASRAIKENINKLRESHGRTMISLVQTDGKSGCEDLGIRDRNLRDV